MSEAPPIKPLGRKAYGSIPHLPGSRRGPGDWGLSDAQARICLTKAPGTRRSPPGGISTVTSLLGRSRIRNGSTGYFPKESGVSASG